MGYVNPITPLLNIYLQIYGRACVCTMFMAYDICCDFSRICIKGPFFIDFYDACLRYFAQKYCKSEVIIVLPEF